MKTLIKRSISQLVTSLPRGIQREIFKQAVDKRTLGYDELRHLASTLNITSLGVRGEYGTFENSISDTVIMKGYAETGNWSPKTNNRLAAFFETRGGGTYIDVGANVGLTVVPVARNPKVFCVALEPEPTTFSYLTKNIAINCKHNNISARQIAAFERADTLEFEIAQDNLGDHRIRLSDEPGVWNEQDRPTISVAALPLDEVYEPRSGPLAVKVDTQGAEPFVIKGGRKTVATADLLILEFWPYGMNRMGGDAEDVIGFIEQNFTKIRVFVGEKAEELSTVNVAEKLREFAHTFKSYGHFYADVVASKN